MELLIEHFRTEDWDQVNKIFIQGIETGNSTFTKVPPSQEEWESTYVLESCIVARINNEVVGWVAIKPVSNRPVFVGVAEVSVYIRKGFRGNSIGKRLLSSVIDWSEANGYWTIQSNIFPENISSIKLHKSLGFKEVGVREKIGQMDGRWRDIILLDRRSNKVGV